MYKEAIRFATVALLLGTSLFATSCKDNDENEIVKENPTLDNTSFSLVSMKGREWNSSALTRATSMNEQVLDLSFSEGDMLYIQGFQTDANQNVISTIVGNLTMENGGGQKAATFEGELYAPEGTTLDDFQNITYFLVGANDKRAKFTDVYGTTAKIINLPLEKNHIVSSFKEAIEKYSNIGYVSPTFTDEVQLQQASAFFIFNVYFNNPDFFDEVASISATFIKPNGSSIVVTTEENPTGFKINNDGCLQAVAPCDIEDKREVFTDIELEIKAKNGKTFSMNFPSNAEGGNVVEQGEVYTLTSTLKDKTVLPTLTSESKEGDRGMIGDIEFLVVNLNGKLKAIATTNVGAENITDFGNYYLFNEIENIEKVFKSSYNSRLHIMREDEAVALIKGNQNNGAWTNVNGVKGWKYSFDNGNSLFFPAAGYEMAYIGTQHKVGEEALVLTSTPVGDLPFPLKGDKSGVTTYREKEYYRKMPIRLVCNITLDYDDPEGAVGYLEGKEGMVVDLGGTYGKVVIATNDEEVDSNKFFFFEDAKKLSDPEGWYMPNYNSLTALDDKYKDVKQPNELNTAITYHIGENVLSFDYAGCLYYAKTWPNIYSWVYKDPEPYKKGEIYLCWTTSVYSSQSHYCFSFEQSGKNDYKHRFPDVDYGISLRLFHKL